jgi:plastocyanin
MHLVQRREVGLWLVASAAWVLAAVLPAPVSAASATVRGAVTADALATPGDIVVSLEAPGLEFEAPAGFVRIDNVNFLFVPRVLAIVPGTTVRWVNGDPEPQNVYSPEGRYNLGNLMPGEWGEHRFDEPGAYTQLCRIHPDGLGFVVVVATPYYDVTDAEGHFEIGDVAPGHYELVAWSEELDPLTQEIDVAPGQTLTLSLDFE